MDITEELVAENVAMVEALAFCQKDGRDNRWLVSADEWVARVLIAATTDIGFEKRVGIPSNPDPARAVVVSSISTSTIDPDDENALIYGRAWRYVPELEGRPLHGLDGMDGGLIDNCHRCTFDLFDAKRATAIVYVPRGRFVVEFAFCRDCMVHLASLAERIAETNRIASDDSYVEYERSARVGEDDTEM